MNIVREELKDLTTLLKVTVSETDYKAEVDKELHGYRRKATIPGFRPGMTPMGVINKMYRKGVLAEVSYREATKAVSNYLQSEKLDIMGEVIPSEQQKPFDFDTQTKFEFVFEAGIAPEVKIALSPKDKVKRYEIKIDDTMRAGYRANFLRRFGRLVDVDKVTKDEAVTGTLDQEAMQVQEAYVGLVSMDDKQRKPFIGKKVGDTLKVDINELYPNPSQRASILQVEESELEGIDPKFTLTITQIRQFAEPEMNEEFFKTAFPGGEVTDEKGLNQFLDTQIAGDLSRESNQMFLADMRRLLIDKANLTLPAAFLKRWLIAVNEGKATAEEIEKGFDQFLMMMAWSLIEKHYISELKLEITPEESLDEAKAYTRMQFAAYGMGEVPDAMLTNYANNILNNEEESRKIYEMLFERKVIEAVEPMITVTESKVSVEEFQKIAQKSR